MPFSYLEQHIESSNILIFSYSEIVKHMSMATACSSDSSSHGSQTTLIALCMMICQYYVEIATPIFYIAKLQMRMLNNENVAFRVLRVE